MARKKKFEEKTEDTLTQPDYDDAPVTPSENSIAEGVVTLTEDELENGATTTAAIVTDSPHSPADAIQDNICNYASKISRAFDAIERCNLYMWAGLDWGAGRRFELSRNEWANYVLAMYDWSDKGFKGKEPEMPTEVKYD